MTRAAAQDLADRITAAGVRATTDPRNVNPPCVYVGPPLLRFDVACGATAEWVLRLVLPPGPFTADTWDAADQALDLLTDVITPDLITPNTDLDPPQFTITFEEAI